jgi:hypothetical protein
VTRVTGPVEIRERYQRCEDGEGASTISSRDNPERTRRRDGRQEHADFVTRRTQRADFPALRSPVCFASRLMGPSALRCFSRSAVPAATSASRPRFRACCAAQRAMPSAFSGHLKGGGSRLRSRSGMPSTRKRHRPSHGGASRLPALSGAGAIKVDLADIGNDFAFRTPALP